MDVIRGLARAKHLPGGPSAITIGCFDGVHLGHRAVLTRLSQEAERRGLTPTVVTFVPHPRAYFAARAGTPDLAPARLASLRDNLRALEGCGVRRTLLLRFDGDLARQTPQEFVDTVLVNALDTRYVLVGDDFRFGARRAGDFAFLDAAGRSTSAASGFDAERMSSHELLGNRISSSAVRQAVSTGDVELAAKLLGRPYALSGRLVHADKPTINGSRCRPYLYCLQLPPYLRPALSGVFMAAVRAPNGEVSRCVISIPASCSGIEDRRPQIINLGRTFSSSDQLRPSPQVRLELLQKLRDAVVDPADEPGGGKHAFNEALCWLTGP